MRAFIKRFLMHYGIYRRYPLGRFPALQMRGVSLSPDANHRRREGKRVGCRHGRRTTPFPALLPQDRGADP
jgi:hypothetical protein